MSYKDYMLDVYEKQIEALQKKLFSSQLETEDTLLEKKILEDLLKDKEIIIKLLKNKNKAYDKFN